MKSRIKTEEFTGSLTELEMRLNDIAEESLVVNPFVAIPVAKTGAYYEGLIIYTHI